MIQKNSRINDPAVRINFPSIMPPDLPENIEQSMSIVSLQRSVWKHLATLAGTLITCLIVLYARSFDEVKGPTYVNKTIPQSPPPSAQPVINSTEEPDLKNQFPTVISITDPIIGKNYFNIVGE